MNKEILLRISVPADTQIDDVGILSDMLKEGEFIGLTLVEVRELEVSKEVIVDEPDYKKLYAEAVLERDKEIADMKKERDEIKRLIVELKEALDYYETWVNNPKQLSKTELMCKVCQFIENCSETLIPKECDRIQLIHNIEGVFSGKVKPRKKKWVLGERVRGVRNKKR